MKRDRKSLGIAALLGMAVIMPWLSPVLLPAAIVAWLNELKGIDEKPTPETTGQLWQRMARDMWMEDYPGVNLEALRSGWD